MPQEHCEGCGQFLDHWKHIYCEECLDNDYQENSKNGIIAMSQSKLNLAKYLLHNEGSFEIVDKPPQVISIESTESEGFTALQIPHDKVKEVAEKLVDDCKENMGHHAWGHTNCNGELGHEVKVIISRKSLNEFGLLFLTEKEYLQSTKEVSH